MGTPCLCHQPDKSCDQKYCDSGDIIFSICHVAFREHMFKGLLEFMLPCLLTIDLEQVEIYKVFNVTRPHKTT